MKSFEFKIDPLTGEEYYDVYLRGLQLLTDPLLNKASCFTEEERITLELGGLLPHGVSRIEDQVERCMEAYRPKPDDLERYIYLQGLLNRNETLFYRLLTENLSEMVPIVYTPTVGQACLMMSHIMRHPRGIYIHPGNIARVDDIFQNISLPQVQLIVVTDGERILGLGDLGSDGMGIPVGKVSLYVAAGGLHPASCLPMCIDVGTNNERLLNDPLYMGYRKPRLDGTEYFDFVERFVLGVKRNFPNTLLQWEDFSKQKAFTLLSRYRERILCFNDDIQGTGATACAALLTAMRIQKSRFADQRYVIVGMGQAGVGIADSIMAILKEEGLSEGEARRRIFAIDQQGLLVEDDPALEEQQRRYTQPRAALTGWKLENAMRIQLLDVIRNAGATVLIGVTAKRGLFDERMLRQVAQNADRPIVLALSNPTTKSECTPEEFMRASSGRGLIATGSPFPPLKMDGREIGVAQCNNLFIFPGMGLGALVAKANKVTDQMFIAVSKTLSGLVTPDQAERGYLLPEMRDIRRVSFEVALAVAREARDAGLGRLLEDEKLATLIKKAQWDPHFYPYRAGRQPM
ncbi:MAG: NAD-dependent malic enzyme [Candidatus Methylomirabilota bacterium]|jgi:malate dehydrogenase (oxaloacetate-decarboxylating)